MSITITRCPFAELEAAHNFQALMDEYAKDAALEGLPPPKANLELYRAMEAAGFTTTIVALVDNRVIGAAILNVVILPHYSVPIATIESLFVEKRSRNTGAGLFLLIEAESAAKGKGAKGLFVNAAIGSKLEAMMMAKKSYNPTHTAFLKVFE